MIADAEKILVPVDGSEESRKAFAQAVAIAKRIDAQVEVISVINEDSIESQSSQKTEKVFQSLQESRLRLLEKYAEMAREKYDFHKVKTFTVIGKPKYQIIHVVREDPAFGLIVIGATGKNAVERSLLGSVSQYIIREAPIPVLIVR